MAITDFLYSNYFLYGLLIYSSANENSNPQKNK